MPKKVDHRERRARIADALLRVAAGQGLEAVSLRHVAAEAGVSVGMVQHYFRSKDEMMLFALARVSENVVGRLEQGGSLRALLLQMLPLDPQRRMEGQVSLAFAAYAAVRPEVGAGLRDGAAGLRDHVAGIIGSERGGGDTPVDARMAATALLALVDGLGVHVLGGSCTADDAVAILDAHLAVLFGQTGGGLPGRSPCRKV